MEILRIRIVKTEIKDTYRIDGLEIIVPTVTTNSLVTDWEGGVKNTAVFEKLLLCLLHLNEKFLATLILTINIENSLAIYLTSAKLLAVEVGKITDNLFAIEHGVEKTDKKVFVYLGTEQLLKSKIRIEVNISLVKIA